VLDSAFYSMKFKGSIATPPKWEATLSQVTRQHSVKLPQQYTGTHLYNWVKRGTVRLDLSRATTQWPRPGVRFSKVPKSFRTRKAEAKSQTLWLQICFIHILLIWTKVHFIQGVLGVYTSLFLDTEDIKMASRGGKVSGAFEKRAPGLKPGPLVPNPAH